MTQMHDSGKRQSFDSGAVRDTADEKARPDLISPHADAREGEWMRLGAAKYDERNWEKGIPISRCIASLRRHLLAYMLGQQDEDHMAAVRTNASFILHFEEEIKAGRMDPAIDDMPGYEQRIRKYRCGSLDVHEVSDIGQEHRHPVRRVRTDGKGNEYETVTVLSELPDRSADIQALDAKRYGWPTYYIAGPMRGYPQFNFPAFDAVRDKLLDWTPCTVISPADMDREAGFNPNVNQEAPDDLGEVMRRDLDAILTHLRPGTQDGIVLLPGWQASRGAAVEVALARFLGLKLYDSETGQEINL